MQSQPCFVCIGASVLPSMKKDICITFLLYCQALQKLIQPFVFAQLGCPVVVTISQQLFTILRNILDQE